MVDSRNRVQTLSDRRPLTDVELLDRDTIVFVAPLSTACVA
jgi:hypothetical protein